MRTVVFGTIAYALTFFGTSLALAGLGIYQHAAGGANRLDNFFMAAYFVFLAGTAGTAGFLLVTAASPAWRRQRIVQAMVIGAAASVVAMLLYVTGIASLPLALLLPSSTLRSWPRASAAAFFATPGVLTGFVAIGVARLRARRDAARRP
jgi:hypothetical protein